LVFEEAKTNVGGGGGGKFHGSASYVRGGLILDGRGNSIKGVGCEVGAAVEHAY